MVVGKYFATVFSLEESCCCLGAVVVVGVWEFFSWGVEKRQGE
jgi:hypothetical protein